MQGDEAVKRLLELPVDIALLDQSERLAERYAGELKKSTVCHFSWFLMATGR